MSSVIPGIAFRSGGTLGRSLGAATPGSWVAQGFWTREKRHIWINLQEPSAIRQLLSRHFADFVSNQEVRRVLVQEENQAVAAVLTSMVSPSPALLS